MIRDFGKMAINIVLVEDDLICSLMAKIKLKQLGIENVTTIEDGALALSYLATNRPDLVFLDIAMPGMDGFEFLDAIPDQLNYKGFPIVMLTASVRSCDRDRALQYSRVIDYLEKPLNISKIERVLAKLELPDKRISGVI